MPTTFSDWSAKLKALQSLVDVCCLNVLCKDNGAYSFLWTLRAWWQVDLRTKELRLEGGGRLSLLGEVFPDQKGLLGLIEGQTQTTDKFIRRTKYGAPLELLTMWMCLFGTAEVMSVSTDELKRRVPELRALKRSFHADHGVIPHPAWLVKQLCE